MIFYQAGLMDEETWSAKVIAMTVFNNCPVRSIVVTRKPTFSKHLKALIDTFPDECGLINISHGF